MLPWPLRVLIAVATVALVAFILWFQGNQKEAATGASQRLAAAIEANDPSAAPDGTDGYVRGVRAYFGPVSECKFLGAREESIHTHGKSYDTFWVSELLVRSSRGAAVLELEFSRSVNPGNENIVAVRELEPDRVHTKLDQPTKAALGLGFSSRGGKVASLVVLDGTFKPGEVGSPVSALP